MSISFASRGGNYISPGSPSSLDNLSAFTYLGWFYFTDLTSNDYGLFGIGSFGSQTRKDWNIYTGSSPHITRCTVDRATTDCDCEVGGGFSNYSTNTWYFLAYTWDGSAAPRMLRGTLTSLAAEPSSYTTQTAGSGTIGDSSASNFIVGNIGIADRSLIGRVGRAMVFNRGLSNAEIIQLQFAPAALSGCVLWYEPGFYGTSAVPDWSGTANAGTITNGSLADHVPIAPLLGQDDLLTAIHIPLTFPTTIDYTGMPWVRPAGQDLLPLILRNPQNDNTKKDYLKDGLSPVLKIAPADYRMWIEGVTDQTGGLTNYFFYATSANGWQWTKSADNAAMDPNASPDWEKGEICPDTWFYDIRTYEHRMYYHGGNNVGPRQIGLMTSPTGKVGSWTRYGSNPILANGSSGAWDETMTTDPHVIQLAPSSYVMLYRGSRASDGKAQIGLATSSDGISWTKYASNPVLALGTGNDVNGAFGMWFYVDSNNRWHCWYVGESSTANDWRILYAYSDDNGHTWTRNQADVMYYKSSISGSPDHDTIGDCIRAWIDEGIIMFTQMNQNLTTYTGDALGRLEGRGLAWLPLKAASKPIRPGRCVRPIASSARSYMTVPVGAKLLASSTFSIYQDFRCLPGDTLRTLYQEYAASDKQVYLQLDTGGTITAKYITPTGTATLTSAARFDDNKYHRALFRRTASNAFSLYVDGSSVATSSTECGTDSTALTYHNLLGNDPANTAFSTSSADGLGGISRRLVTIAGYAMSDAEELALWKNGDAGGPAPGSGTLKLDLLFGSSGPENIDVDRSANAYKVTAFGTEVVETNPPWGLAPVLDNEMASSLLTLGL